MRRASRILRALLLPPLVIALVVGVVMIGRSGWQATAAVRDLRAAAGAAAPVETARRPQEADALRLASVRLRPVACERDPDAGGGPVVSAVLSAVVASAERTAEGVTNVEDGPAEVSLLLLGTEGGSLSQDASVEGGELTGVRARTVEGRPALRVTLRIERGAVAVVRTQSGAVAQGVEPRLIVPASAPPTRVRVDPSGCLAGEAPAR